MYGVWASGILCGQWHAVASGILDLQGLRGHPHEALAARIRETSFTINVTYIDDEQWENKPEQPYVFAGTTVTAEMPRNRMSWCQVERKW